MDKNLLKGLSKEQIEKVQQCKNADEILALAKEEGVELTEEQLNAVNGGFCSDTVIECPACGSTDVKSTMPSGPADPYTQYDCRTCGYHWSSD